MSLLQIYYWVSVTVTVTVKKKQPENRLPFGELVGSSSMSCFLWLTEKCVDDDDDDTVFKCAGGGCGSDSVLDGSRIEVVLAKPVDRDAYQYIKSAKAANQVQVYIGWQLRNFNASCVRRHLVGKTLINVFHCDSAEIRFVGKMVIIRTFSWTNGSNVI